MEEIEEIEEKQQIFGDNIKNGHDIIPKSTCESICDFFKCKCCCKSYDLTKEEYDYYRILQNKFSSSFLSNDNCKHSDTLYDSIKQLADKVFESDDEYNDFMNRPNEDDNSKRKKLLNYMGFLFEECYYDVLGVGNVINDILLFGKDKPYFVMAVKGVVNSHQYLFGQTIGHLIYNIKLYMYLDIDNKRLQYKQKGIKIKMERKQLKYFAEYFRSKNGNIEVLYTIICQMFDRLWQELTQKGFVYENKVTIIEDLINKEIKTFHKKISAKIERDFNKDNKNNNYNLLTQELF